MQPTTLGLCQRPGIEVAALHNLDVPVETRENRQPEKRKHQQQSDMKDQQAGLRSEAAIGEQRCQQVDRQHEDRQRGKARVDAILAGRGKRDDSQQRHAHQRELQGCQLAENGHHGGFSHTFFIQSRPVPCCELAEPQSCSRHVPLNRQVRTLSLAFM